MAATPRMNTAGSVALLLVGVLVIGGAVWLQRRNDAAEASSTGTTSRTATTPATTSPPATAAPTMPEPAPPTATGATCTNPAIGIPKQPSALISALSAAAAKAALAKLSTAARMSGKTFCRGAFGPDTWPDLDRNGCTTRQDILVRQAKTVRTAIIASNGGKCREAIAGTWVDAYTGKTLTFTNLKDPRQAAGLQIDHLVALYEAWVSGGQRWPPARRAAFAQSLSTPELYAVDGQGNFAKSYRGIDSWQPVAARQCDIAKAYVQVKSTWQLSVTENERSQLTRMLDSCRA